MGRIQLYLGAGGSCALLALALTPAARAAASNGTSRGAGVGPAFGSPIVRSGSTKTPGFAGYVPSFQLVPGTLQSVTTTFVVPRLNNCTSEHQGIYPEISVSGDGYYFGEMSAGLFIGCYQGKARYYASFMEPGFLQKNFPSRKASPGDKIILSVHTTKRQMTASVEDQTHKGAKATVDAPGPFSMIYADSVGVAGWLPKPSTNSFLPVPDFGTIRFAATTISGVPWGAPANDNTRYDFYNEALTTLKVKTTKFTKNNESFKTIFKHS